MIGLGRWMVAGVAALGAGAVAALISRRGAGGWQPEPGELPAPDPPPASRTAEDPREALDAARARLRRRADEVKQQLEQDID